LGRKTAYLINLYDIYPRKVVQIALPLLVIKKNLLIIIIIACAFLRRFLKKT